MGRYTEEPACPIAVIAPENGQDTVRSSRRGFGLNRSTVKQGPNSTQVFFAMRVPRIPPSVSYISAVAAISVIPYYFISNQPDTAWTMSALAALNFASGWWKL
jgi:hypothetical protein